MSAHVCDVCGCWTDPLPSQRAPFGEHTVQPRRRVHRLSDERSASSDREASAAADSGAAHASRRPRIEALADLEAAYTAAWRKGAVK